MPTVKSVMTPFPYSVSGRAALRAAQEMMKEHDIRHLPVTDERELVGVVSDRDLARAVDPALGLPAPDDLTVSQVMSTDPYTVGLHEPLDGLLLKMAEHQMGCVIVTKDGRIAGIFTATDACRAFGVHLRRSRPEGGDAA